MEPVRVVAAHELVLEQIRTAIMLGRYRPGDSLPPERALADFLHVSRTTVRGAIAILVEDGLIEIKRGRGGGLFVRDSVPSDDQARQAFRQNLVQIRQVFEFRVTIESACARLAAERRTQPELREMRRLYKAMQAMKGPQGQLPSEPALSAQFHSLDTDFHLAIARAAHNPWLEEAALKGRIEMFRPVGSLFNSLDVTGDYLHDRILAAVEDRDAEAASSLMAEHVETTCHVVESWLLPGRKGRAKTPRSAR
jgi:DNA-binding FadR family transcriptional regulator